MFGTIDLESSFIHALCFFNCIILFYLSLNNGDSTCQQAYQNHYGEILSSYSFILTIIIVIKVYGKLCLITPKKNLSQHFFSYTYTSLHTIIFLQIILHILSSSFELEDLFLTNKSFTNKVLNWIPKLPFFTIIFNFSIIHVNHCFNSISLIPLKWVDLDPPINTISSKSFVIPWEHKEC